MNEEVNHPRTSPPWHLWLIPAAVALLRAIPFIVSRATTAEPGFSLMPVGYLPKDWYQYVALIRQAAESGDWFLANPYTTGLQDGRLMVLLLDVLGTVCRWTGADPFWVLELSRIPLLFLLFYVLWRLVSRVLTDPRTRLFACWLVALSGGIEVVVQLTQGLWPGHIWNVVGWALWHVQGWNTFAACFNPIWIAALIVTLLTLEPIIKPGGPAGIRDMLTVLVGFVLLYLIHSYSAMVVLLVAAVHPVLAWLVKAPVRRQVLVRTWSVLLPGLAITVLLLFWQRADVLLGEVSLHTLGIQSLQIFWYPVTLGVAGLFVVRGWRSWILEGHPWRFGLGAWMLAIVFIHSCPVLNGYHFVFHLYIPVCIVAARELMESLTRLRRRGYAGLALAVLLGVAVFHSAVTVTAISADEVYQNRLRESELDLIDVLKDRPGGNVLAPAAMSNAVPALTSHRVYYGHWFLTPDFVKRSMEYRQIASARVAKSWFVELVSTQRIDYLVLPSGIVPWVRETFGDRMQVLEESGGLALMQLRS